MAIVYYDIFFGISVLLTLCYTFMWHKHFDIHFTLIFSFIPITNLGYVLMVHSHELETALTSLKVTYIGGCYLILFIMLNIFSLCGIELKRWHRFVCFLLASAVYSSVLTIGWLDIFYRRVFIDAGESGTRLINKEYGPMHTVYYAMIVIFFALSLGAIVYSYYKKNSVSNRILFMLSLPLTACVLVYVFGKELPNGLELLPPCYVFAQIVFLFIVHRVNLYDIADSSIDSFIQKGDTGFVSLDFRCRYLGSNETARRIMPELSDLQVDKPISNYEKLSDTAIKWIEDFRKDEKNNKVNYKADGKVYSINVNYLFDGRKKRGYQLVMTDDTKNQLLLSLLERYNTDLRLEVEKKTAHIVEMHDKLILSMAMMVESRDNSTGGHIRRTSEVVRLLTCEMQKDSECSLSDEFCRNLVKAAPMHDLGKIAVDDAILRKPGRFTPDEFEKMKAHAAEGASIVHEILNGTDDHKFHIIAENVAHYHHERWDGSGYPEGLKGDEIPIEARIMAIADVYDALVSKRVYKDSMSFEQADSIILEGMGKHFDKSLERFYVSARPKIEEYYSKTEHS